jgi:hypothetical protein
MKKKFIGDWSKQKLDISLLRLARKRKVKMPQTMGEAIDSYEAMLNELQLQTSMLTSQSSIEAQRAEVLTNQLISQINTAEAQVTAELNNYSQDLVASVSEQVKASEQSVNFTDTNLYDMSFISTMDYNKVTVLNDAPTIETRVDRRELYRQQMKDLKLEVTFQQGLIKQTAINDTMLPLLYNSRNHYLCEYYLSCIRFYQEATIMGFLYNPTYNIENLKQYISLNESNLPIAKEKNENNRFSIGEEAYRKECDRLKYIERLLITAQYRLKYVETAFVGKWTPPTFETITKMAEEKNLTYSRTVYDMSEYTRQTLCIPDWIMGIAEMYNRIEMFEQGCAIVPLNPYNPVWIQKAKSVISLESQGVINAASKMFLAIDKYWESLTGCFETIENLHIEAALDKGLREDATPITNLRYTDNLDLVFFDE